MGRIHAVELEDLSWFPDILRDAGTAFLRFASEKLGQANAMRPVIGKALDDSGHDHVVDLCSGGGGPIIYVGRALHAAGQQVRVTMTDLFPNESARELVERDGDSRITYSATPVDATSVPSDLTGLRTMFNAFHHFRPEQAVLILKDAVDDGQPIAVLEVLRRHPLGTLGVQMVPIASLFIVPFLRPFRWSWLVFTYILPLIPLFIWFDGTVSSLRAYNPDEMWELIREADPDERFDWRVEDLDIKGQPIPGVAVVGIPKGGSNAAA